MLSQVIVIFASVLFVTGCGSHMIVGSASLFTEALKKDAQAFLLQQYEDLEAPTLSDVVDYLDQLSRQWDRRIDRLRKLVETDETT